MVKGSVKFFNAQKGYGFIRAEGVTEDVLVHWSDIQMDGFKTLAEGDQVEFRIQRTDKGLKALEVRVTERVEQA